MKKIIFIICTILTFAVGTVYATPDAESNEALKVYNDVKDGMTESISTVYNDSKAVISTVYDDAKDVAEAIYPDAKEAIAQIAKGLGVGVEYVWTVLVKQFFVKGVAELLIFILGLVLLISGIVWFSKYINTTSEITWKFIPILFMFVFALALLCGVEYENMLQGLINPDFGAINYVLDFVKSLR